MSKDDIGRGFYGTKRVEARPQTESIRPGASAAPWNDVRYPDGYVSWSPPDVFEKAYRLDSAMDFSGALAALKDGYTVCRPIWPETEALVMVEGLILHKVSRSRVHNFPVSSILALDWKIIHGPRRA